MLETVHHLSSKQSPGHGLPSLVYGGRHLLLSLSQSIHHLLMARVQGGNQLPHFIDDPLVVLLGMLAVLSSTPALIGWQWEKGRLEEMLRRNTRWRDMTGTLPSTGPNSSHLTALYRPDVGRSDLRVGGLQSRHIVFFICSFLLSYLLVRPVVNCIALHKH